MPYIDKPGTCRVCGDKKIGYLRVVHQEKNDEGKKRTRTFTVCGEQCKELFQKILEHDDREKIIALIFERLGQDNTQYIKHLLELQTTE